MERSERWRWLGLEFAIIVLGVLSALFVDTWIDDRQDAARAAVYRERLIADLERDITNLDAVIDYYGRIRVYGLATLADLEGDAPLDDFSLMFAAFNAAEEFGFALESATYDDMQATGGLALVEDVQIRLDLADYHRTAHARAPVWSLPRDYRAAARGIIPDSLQKAIHEQCAVNAVTNEPQSAAIAPGAALSANVEPLTTSATQAGICGLDPGGFSVARAARELRADTNLRHLLRFRNSEIRVAIALFGGQRRMAEALLTRLRAD